jgi:hypothetical protein
MTGALVDLLGLSGLTGQNDNNESRRKQRENRDSFHIHDITLQLYRKEKKIPRTGLNNLSTVTNFTSPVFRGLEPVFAILV